MHPLSTVLFIIGYGLGLPVAVRMVSVVNGQHRLALAGHQIGMTIAGLGWLVRGSVTMAFAHLAWMVAVRIWFAGRARSASAGR